MTHPLGNGANSGVRAIARALEVIEQLARSEDGLGLVEISQKLALPRSTVHRVLSALVTGGYVLQAPVTQRYRPTLQFVALGGMVQRQVPLCDQARPYLRGLAQRTGESVALAAFDGARVLVVDGIEDPDRIWSRLAIGELRSLHSTAAGKATLSTLAPDQVTRLLPGEVLLARTEKTITSLRALQEQLDAIRACGYAVEDEEHERGWRGVACAIRSKSATLGAIEIRGPSTRLSLDRISEISVSLRSVGEEFSQSLGHDG